jgi:hypothetical protein
MFDIFLKKELENENYISVMFVVKLLKNKYKFSNFSIIKDYLEIFKN